MSEQTASTSSKDQEHSLISEAQESLARFDYKIAEKICSEVSMRVRSLSVSFQGESDS